MTSTKPAPTLTGRQSRGVHIPPVITDIAVVVALLLIGLIQIRHQQQVDGRNQGFAQLPTLRFPLTFALVLPLAWRRQAPQRVFAIVAAVGFIQWLSGPPIAADIAFLWALYAVAAYSPIIRTVAAGVVCECGIVLAIARYTTEGYVFDFLLLSALATAAGALGVNVRIRRAYLAAVEQRAAQLEFERDQQSQIAVAAERSRIAREMHDVIAHNLTVVIALTDGAALTVTTDPERAAAAITEASVAGRTALREMRQVLGVLRDTDESASLRPAPTVVDLDALLETVRRTGLDVQFETSGRLNELGRGVELTIYRLVQEAVTNTVKHAVAPSRIVVRLVRTDDEVCVSVADDGGVPTTAGVGQGLVGMRERVAVHAGQVEAGPTAHGWQVVARLPVADPALPLTAQQPVAISS
jgi:signal transduction histidine kinase